MFRMTIGTVGSLWIPLMVCSLLNGQATGQEPHLAYAYPAGGQVGTTCKVVLGGQHLKEITEVHISGAGVQAELVSWYRPMTRGEYNQLQMKLTEAREKLSEQKRGSPEESMVAFTAGVSEDELREMEVFRERDRDPKRQPNEQLEEELTIRLTIEANASQGKRELRLVSETAVSNPLWIHIGPWTEINESEPNDTTPNRVQEEFPMIINGQIMPGDIDCFTFDAREGEQLVISAGARDVIPYLADAVPGWFQAVLSLTDSAGREVAFADSFEYRQDPVIFFVVPRNDRYTVRISDAIFRGREDFVYRITLGEIPFVTSVFPLGARCGSEVDVEIRGWNLSETKFSAHLLPCGKMRQKQWFDLPQKNGLSVRFPLQVDVLADVFEAEPNNGQESSQPVSTRANIHGRIDSPGDQDVFFISRGGQLVAEVLARREGSPLDSQLTLTDIDGNEIAFNDDHEDRSQGFQTHHADSLLEAFVPSSGAYLRISDTQGNGGKGYVYRLSLRSADPDYEVRVTPGSIVARAGSVVPITAYALRHDNYHEDIELALLNAPAGFELSGAIIPGNADRITLTLSVPAVAPEKPIPLEMITRGRRGRGSRAWLTHPAIPAENMMQAFIWHHLVSVDDWTVSVSGKPRSPAPFRIVTTSPRLQLQRGKVLLLNVIPTVTNIPVNELRVSLDDPKGVTAEMVTGEGGGLAIKVTVDAEEASPGLGGNLLFRAYRETTPAATDANPTPSPRRTDYGYLPALPFKISER